MIKELDYYGILNDFAKVRESSEKVRRGTRPLSARLRSRLRTRAGRRLDLGRRTSDDGRESIDGG